MTEKLDLHSGRFAGGVIALDPDQVTPTLVVQSGFDLELHGDHVTLTVVCSSEESDVESVDVIIVVHDVDDNRPMKTSHNTSQSSFNLTISDEVL